MIAQIEETDEVDDEVVENDVVDNDTMLVDIVGVVDDDEVELEMLDVKPHLVWYDEIDEIDVQMILVVL